MARDRIGAQVENLIRKDAWKQAQAVVEKHPVKTPGDHWLWARLSGVRYEQRDDQGALEAAEKALDIVPDCPLALWGKAGAAEMLGRPAEAFALYCRLYGRGLEQLTNPDEDANECWEGSDWTSGLMADCLFRAAGCMAKTGRRSEAVETYLDFLKVVELVRSIYTADDARARLNRLVPSKKAKRDAAVKVLERETELIPG